MLEILLDLLSRALDLVAPDSHDAGRILSRYGHALGREASDYEAAQEAFRNAIAIAKKENDVALEMATLSNGSEVDFMHLQYQSAIEKSTRAIELRERVDEQDYEWFLSGGQFALLASVNLGDIETARQHADRNLAAAEGTRHAGAFMGTLLSKSYISMLNGDWDDARNFNEQVIERTVGQMRSHFQRIVIEYETGNLDAGNMFLDELPNIYGTDYPAFAAAYVAVALPMTEYIASRPGELSVALAACQRVLTAENMLPIFKILAQVGRGLCAVLQSDSVAASESYRALKPQHGTIIGHWTGFQCDRQLGLLAQTMGNLDDAAAHFEDSLEFCRKPGYRAMLAWSLCDYADMLRERNGERDEEKAIELLDESLALSTELGMRPLMERVLSRREILKA